jgi:hypothetical protein
MHLRDREAPVVAFLTAIAKSSFTSGRINHNHWHKQSLVRKDICL